MIRVEELIRERGHWVIKTLYLNPSWIIRIQEDYLLTKNLRCEQNHVEFPPGLDPRHTLSKVTYAYGSSTTTATVVGTPETIHEKVVGQKQLLRG